MEKISKRKVALLLALGIMGTSFNILASPLEHNADQTETQSIITPYFTYIIHAYNSFVLNSGGRFTCKGETEVNTGYDAAITLEIQQYKNGSWVTLQSWYYSDSDYASLSKDWYVASGYSYRLKNTHQTLLNGRVVETYISYSDTKSYN